MNDIIRRWVHLNTMVMLFQLIFGIFFVSISGGMLELIFFCYILSATILLILPFIPIFFLWLFKKSIIADYGDLPWPWEKELPMLENNYRHGKYESSRMKLDRLSGVKDK